MKCEIDPSSNGLLPMSYANDEDDYIDDYLLSAENIDLHKSVFLKSKK